MESEPENGQNKKGLIDLGLGLSQDNLNLEMELLDRSKPYHEIVLDAEKSQDHTSLCQDHQPQAQESLSRKNQSQTSISQYVNVRRKDRSNLHQDQNQRWIK